VRARGGDVPTGTYFADWALPQARKQSDVGYARETITTTLDARLQAAARRAVSGARLGKAQVALVAMRPDGEVVAMIGGRDYAKSPFNRATQAKRQPGSTFKLFVYLAALKAGMTPDDRIANTPIETGSYRPQNGGGAYSDSITLADAFARSSNVAAVRLWQQVGDDAVIDMARDLGISVPLTRGDPSLALGTSSVTLLEMTAAFAAVAGDRYPVVPHAFVREEQGWFDWLVNGPSRFPGAVQGGIRDMLRAAVEKGTGRSARLGQPAYGKTGTSQLGRDALFIGWSGDLVVGVWVGNDDNSPLAGMTGGGVPARIWRDFMTRAGSKAAVPERRANPRGPVEPLDVQGSGDIPLGDGSSVRIEDGAAVISTDIGGVPLDVRVDAGEIAERIAAQRAAAEAAARAAEAAAEAALEEARARAEMR
jgi:penicillin-binding protein 1A